MDGIPVVDPAIDGIPIDVADVKVARIYAKRYLWFISVCAAMFAFFLITRRQFDVYGWIWAVAILVVPLYFRWQKIARLLEDETTASKLACALAQKGADYGRACQVLRGVFDTATETATLMADPRTWGKKQRLCKFSTVGIEVFVYERNGIVGDLKAYLR